MDQTSEACFNSGMCTALETCSSPRPSRKNEFRPCLGRKILNFEKIIGGKNFENVPPKFAETRVLLEIKSIIKCTNSVVEASPCVNHAVVVRIAVSMAGQVSNSEAFFSLFETHLFSFSSFFERRRLDCPVEPIKAKLNLLFFFRLFL